MIEAKRGTHRVDICRILNKTPYPLELFWIAKDSTDAEKFDPANWLTQKRTTPSESIHSFQNSYNGHCFGFSTPALGGKVMKHAAIIKLHEATKQWYTVRQALTADGSAHPDGPLWIEGHSEEPDWTTYTDPCSPARPGPQPAAPQPPAAPVFQVGDAIEVSLLSLPLSLCLALSVYHTLSPPPPPPSLSAGLVCVGECVDEGHR